MKTSEALEHIFGYDFAWPGKLETMKEYRRLHDDHDGTEMGNISIVIGGDGDAHIATEGRKPCESLRYRTSLGGGRSPRVRAALLVLAEAIRLDNNESA